MIEIARGWLGGYDTSYAHLVIRLVLSIKEDLFHLVYSAYSVYCNLFSLRVALHKSCDEVLCGIFCKGHPPGMQEAFSMAEGITLGLWVLSKLSIELN